MSGDETEPHRHFDTDVRVDQEHLEAVIQATPVETRPLLDLAKLRAYLAKLRAYLAKLRASFEFGPSQREPTALVSPARYAQSLLRRIEQLAGELKEIASPRAGTTPSNVFKLFTSWKGDAAAEIATPRQKLPAEAQSTPIDCTGDATAEIATPRQKLPAEAQSTPIDCTVDAAAEIATLGQKLAAAEARIQEKAKSTPTLDDLRERMAALNCEIAKRSGF